MNDANVEQIMKEYKAEYEKIGKPHPNSNEYSQWSRMWWFRKGYELGLKEKDNG